LWEIAPFALIAGWQRLVLSCGNLWEIPFGVINFFCIFVPKTKFMEEQVLFIGQFKGCRFDEKARVVVPAKFRKQLQQDAKNKDHP